MRTLILPLLSLASGLATASVIQARYPSNCIDVTLTVSATAQNRVIFVQPDFSTLAGIIAFATQPVQFTTVSGPQTFHGLYCAPTVHVPSRAHTLQLLVHGATYDHTYFTGLGAFQSNSWVAYANAEGYPTLAIDRLGAGQSSHPDPVAVVQPPYEIELFQNLIQQIRNVGYHGMPKFSKIVWVGHSIGSQLANYLAAAYPTAVDAYILTGIAIPLPDQNASPGQFAEEFVPASTYDPRRFPPAEFPSGYLTTANKSGRRDSYYSDPRTDFNPAIFDLDFRSEGTFPAGGVLATPLATITGYSGPVFVLTGREDVLSCGNGSRALGIPDCGTGPTSQLAAVKQYYPAVPSSSFGWYAQEHSGHCLQLHYAARSGFQKAHQFLEQVGW